MDLLVTRIDYFIINPIRGIHDPIGSRVNHIGINPIGRSNNTVDGGIDNFIVNPIRGIFKPGSGRFENFVVYPIGSMSLVGCD